MAKKTDEDDFVIAPEFVLSFPTWNVFENKEDPKSKTILEILPAGDVYVVNVLEDKTLKPLFQLRITSRAIRPLISLLHECDNWLKSMPEDGPEYEDWKGKWDHWRKTKPLPEGIERIKLDE
jgi:hypothetical protein